MKKKLITLTVASALFVCGAGLAIGQNKQIAPVEAASHQENFDPFSYEGTYYDNLNTDGSDGISGGFKNALGIYVRPKDWYDYSSGLRVQLQKADEDPTNSANMIYFYTRDSVTKNGASTWNREHVWPQSLSNGHWGEDNGGCDMLHIRPTYNSTNSARGNLVYGNCNKQGEKIYGGVVYGYVNGNYFEPLDCVKGDVARIIMYMYMHYNNAANMSSISGWKDRSYYGTMDVRRVMGPNSVSDCFKLLRLWNAEDPVSQMEKERNEEGYQRQGNRNPFIDHPSYADEIWG